jgi:hypothetical protein
LSEALVDRSIAILNCCHPPATAVHRCGRVVYSGGGSDTTQMCADDAERAELPQCVSLTASTSSDKAPIKPPLLQHSEGQPPCPLSPNNNLIHRPPFR